MNDLYEAFLFYENLSPSERNEVRERLESDPDAAEAFAQWRAIEQRVAEEMQTALPDRHLLVLFALEADGHRGMLTTQEQIALDEARGDIERAMKRHPSIETIVRDIQEARSDFDAVWDENWSEVATTASEDAFEDRVPKLDLDVDVPNDRSRSDGRQARAARSRSQRDGRMWRRIAGTALVAAAAVMVIFLWPREPNRTVIEVAAGSSRTVELADGSSVRLAGDTRMSYKEAREGTFDRQVHIDYGRAFFDIFEKPRPQPFVVETPTARTTVLGTRFGVVSASDETQVTLATGSVQVQSAGSTDDGVMLQPSQQSRVRRGEAPSAPATVDLTRELAWSGLYVFSKTPVDDIADRLSQVHDVDITVATSLQGEPVTGTFEQNQSPKQILEVVASTLGATLRGDEESGFQIVPIQNP